MKAKAFVRQGRRLRGLRQTSRGDLSVHERCVTPHAQASLFESNSTLDAIKNLTSRGKNLPLYHVKKRNRSELLNMKREQELKLHKLAA
ncbi:hypothetical protein NC653_004339 [Populus alba x Populus x berolinensis]|uniref:Uncharacterized protein n=1 Tax=Populus alba x Populus x berolinensis TaxID=444605 RepID=A0AAD6RTS1_9ROSI|nr:hypothetical protein NC653_004339 [Populus alba x Populus x berolinensis]